MVQVTGNWCRVIALKLFLKFKLKKRGRQLIRRERKQNVISGQKDALLDHSHKIKKLLPMFLYE